MTRHTGAWVTGYGVALLLFGAVVLFSSENDTWNSVGLVLGALGGLAVGTGLSLIIYPDSTDIDVYYGQGPEDSPEWTDQPTWVVCLGCGQPGCDGEPCVNPER